MTNAGTRTAASRVVVAALLVGGGCAPAPEGGAASPAPVPATVAAQQQARSLVPAGYGTLRQDDITVSLRSGAVLVKVTPLDEGVIRLVAPDTYRRLSALAESRREAATRGAMREPDLFMVSFFSYEPDVPFQPEDVQLFHQARQLRASVIIPLTGGWGRQRLGQQETQMAIYAFEGPIDHTQAIRVRYGAMESDEWNRILPRLETERANVLARAGG